MPKIVPSQVVALINEVAPKPVRGDPTGPRFERDEGLRKVAPVLALLEKIPEQHFALLSPQSYLKLQLTVSEIEQAVTMWQNESTYDTKLSGGFKINGVQLRTIGDILATCPDDEPAVADTTLAFLADPDLEAVLRQDIGTAHKALSNGEFKSACVMAGS